MVILAITEEITLIHQNGLTKATYNKALEVFQKITLLKLLWLLQVLMLGTELLLLLTNQFKINIMKTSICTLLLLATILVSCNSEKSKINLKIKKLI